MLQTEATANERANIVPIGPSLNKTLGSRDNTILILQLQEAAAQARRKAEQAMDSSQRDLAQVYLTMAQARDRAAAKLIAGISAPQIAPRRAADCPAISRELESDERHETEEILAHFPRRPMPKSIGSIDSREPAGTTGREESVRHASPSPAAERASRWRTVRQKVRHGLSQRLHSGRMGMLVHTVAGVWRGH